MMLMKQKSNEVEVCAGSKDRKKKNKKMGVKKDMDRLLKEEECKIEEEICDIPCEVEMDEGGCFEEDFEELHAMRKEQKLPFKELGVTKEYAETHYYNVKYRT